MSLDYVALSGGQEDCAIEGLVLVLDERLARARVGRGGHRERSSLRCGVLVQRIALSDRGWTSHLLRRKPVPE
jgi:hypothetical protein